MTDVHLARRRARLADSLGGGPVEVAAVVPGPNFTYQTGLHFHLMERPTILFIARTGEVLAIMPALERLKWAAAFPDATTFYWQDSDGFEAAFEAAAATLGDRVVGVEGQRMRVFEADALRRHMGQGAVQDAEAGISGVRISKDAAEVAALEQAIAISETALAETLDETRAGMTEREIRALLQQRMLAGGAEGIAFGPIVLAGGAAANPHGSSGDRPLRPGDPLLIDFGASAGGYNADITRTVFCEHATDEHAAIYQAVLDANAKGREIAGPSLTAHDLDHGVTAVLAASPFADLIVHKTGHGLGLDVHEAPQIMIGNHAPLPAGAVITIEPGLYRADDIGVRIEDDVLITEDGARSLTAFPRELQLIGV